MSAAHPAGRLVPGALLGIVVLGTALRVYGALHPFEAASPDAKVYAQLATSLWRDGTYSARVADPTQFSPGAPLFYAAVYSVIGEADREIARLVVATLAIPTVVLTYLLTLRIAGPVLERGWERAAGLLAALLVAVWPVLIVFSSSFWSESIAVGFLLGAVLGVLWALDGRLRRWLLPGLAFGATAMLRPEYLGVSIVVAGVVAIILVRERGPGYALGASALLVGGVALALAPWTARNAVVLDRLVPVSTGGGKALYIGTYVPARGIDVTVKRQLLQKHPFLRRPGAEGIVSNSEVSAARADRLLTRLMARQHPGVPTDEALSLAARENLRRWIRERPLEVAEVAAFKVWRMWRRGPRAVSRHPVVLAVHLAAVGFGLLGLLIFARRRRREALILAAILVSVTAVAVLLIATPRRNVPLMPVVLVLASTAAVWLAQAASTASRARSRAVRSPQAPGSATSESRTTVAGTRTR